MLFNNITEIIIALIEFLFYLLVPSFVDAASVSYSLYFVDADDKSGEFLFITHYDGFEVFDY